MGVASNNTTVGVASDVTAVGVASGNTSVGVASDVTELGVASDNTSVGVASSCGFPDEARLNREMVKHEKLLVNLSLAVLRWRT